MPFKLHYGMTSLARSQYLDMWLPDPLRAPCLRAESAYSKIQVRVTAVAGTLYSEASSMIGWEREENLNRQLGFTEDEDMSIMIHE
jgi:hypothetical protein